jgi:putative salt-induced outer membrane protein YdiY
MKKSLLVIVMGLSLVNARGFADEKAAEAPKELASSIALGVNANDGNTDNSMYTASLTLDYNPDANTSARLALDAAYGETDGDKSTDNAKAQADYKHLFNERCYAFVNSSLATDDIADLDYRWVLSVGPGYYLMKREEVYMNFDIGPALISQKKGGESTEDFALRFAERYERKTSTGAKYWQSVEFLPFVDDFDLYVLNAEIGVEAPISQELNLRLVVKDTYDSNPAEGREYNDVSVIGALAYTVF